MAIEDNTPFDNEEVDVEEEATVTFEDPEYAVEEDTA